MVAEGPGSSANILGEFATSICTGPAQLSAQCHGQGFAGLNDCPDLGQVLIQVGTGGTHQHLGLCQCALLLCVFREGTVGTPVPLGV